MHDINDIPFHDNQQSNLANIKGPHPMVPMMWKLPTKPWFLGGVEYSEGINPQQYP